MKPTEIKQVLSQLGGGANKTLGQHFLVDESALLTIIAEAEIEKGDRVLEIGPGLGVLTRQMLDGGAHVAAVERDRRFVGFLTGGAASAFSRFREADTGRKARAATGPVSLEVMQGDAAKLDWENHFKTKNWKFIANLPYAITSLAIRKALYAKHPPSNLVVLIQREVAERISPPSRGGARGGEKMSLLSLMVRLASHEARIVKRVAAGSFFPPPKVESAILRVIPMTTKERLAVWGMDPEEIMAVAKQGFAHPRKKLMSNLGLKDPKVFIELGLDPNIRAEDLHVEDWVRLAQAKQT